MPAISRFHIVDLWRASPVWHVVVPTIIAIFLAVAATAVYLPGAMQSAAIDSAYRSNIEVADQIKITRGYYTRTVVAKALDTGILTPSYNHANDPKAIPLPATFVKDISDLLQKKDTTLSLISPYPWPHRADRTMDAFQTRAWEAFQVDPDAVFSRQERRDGKRILRVAVADRMTGATCVNCHNTDRQSVKTDWKIGDVRAVMEVTKVVEPYLAAAEQRSGMIVWSLGATALVVVVVLLSIATLVVRRAREKHLADSHVHYLAQHDALTGTLNRAAFGRRFDSVLANRGTSSPEIAVHYVDLDGFKDVNDKFGHDIGDELVRAAADRLRRVSRGRDVLARLGGDEFVLVQDNVTPLRDATQYAAAIVDAMSPPFSLEAHQVSISASVGVMISAGCRNSADLLKGADIALYRAKRAGRGRFVVFDPDMQRELDKLRELEHTIRHAANHGGFDLHFQPIWRVDGCKLVGFEALLRLPNAEGKFIPPMVFIPVAERLGLITQIGAWVIHEACAVAATWPEHLTIAVNLSPLQFRSTANDEGAISDIVTAALARTRLGAHRLELEVTENALLEGSGSVHADLQKLRQIGVALVIDDFGTGYSSLNYIWKFPFSKIKLDRAFAAGSIVAESTIGAIVKAITGLAQTLGLRVTVEGIESSEQVQLFAELGCHEMQGYFLGGPLPRTQIAATILSDFCRRERLGLTKAGSGHAAAAKKVQASTDLRARPALLDVILLHQHHTLS